MPAPTVPKGSRGGLQIFRYNLAMLTVPHVVAGAAIGSLVGDLPGQNVFAFAVGWGTHYVLDAVPHWEEWFGKEIHGYPSDAAVKNIPKSIALSGVLDFVAAAILLVLLLRTSSSEQFYQSPIFWGALGGFFPDFLDNIPILKEVTVNIPGVQAERNFHNTVHISEAARRKVPRYTGLITQLIVVGAGLWLLL